MNKVLFLFAVMLCLAVRWVPASAQDLDVLGTENVSGYNSLLTYSQIKHNSPWAMAPLSVRNRYLKRKAKVNQRPALSGSTRFHIDSVARKRTLSNIALQSAPYPPAGRCRFAMRFRQRRPHCRHRAWIGPLWTSHR